MSAKWDLGLHSAKGMWNGTTGCGSSAEWEYMVCNEPLIRANMRHETSVLVLNHV